MSTSISCRAESDAAAASATTTSTRIGRPPHEHGSDADADADADAVAVAVADVDVDAAGDAKENVVENECQCPNDDDDGTFPPNLSDDDDDSSSVLIEKITSALRANHHPTGGSDSRGRRTYRSIAHLWNDDPDDKDDCDSSDSDRDEREGDGHDGHRRHHDAGPGAPPTTTDGWYDRALSVYDDPDRVPATVDGMLGGQAHVSPADISESRSFLLRVLRDMRRDDGSSPLGLGSARCAEAGAGIGRVTKHLLLPMGFDRCDLIEASPRLLEAAPGYLGDEMAGRCRFFRSGLQDWTPPAAPPGGGYDLIWIQWVLCYLTDVDCVRFLGRCGLGLKDGGVVVLKENVLSRDDDDGDGDGEEDDDESAARQGFLVDEDDASLTRSLPYMLTLCDLAGLDVVHSCWQEDFPEELFPVRMIALEPRERGRGRSR